MEMLNTTAMDLSSIIDAITCPITADIMTDPVQGTDGQTYERSAIVQALNIKQESPITRAYMTINDLKVNASIRFLCDKYHSGAFGNTNTAKLASAPATISTDNIKVIHKQYSPIIKEDWIQQTMLSFEIDQASMPQSIKHLSQDVVIIIDHSGSMGAAVEAKDQNGNKLEDGMSIQDIVNHAAKTVAKTLDKNSRLSLIIFDNRIDVVFDLMLMTEINCSSALTKIAAVKPAGQTNIWGALERGIRLLNDRTDKTRNGAIVLLTDGAPNISPARGEVDALKRLRKSLNFTSPIYTFGFGYSLCRGLLYDIAKYGNGGNGHIPDGGMIATVFCNFIATIMTTIAVNLQLHIDYTCNSNDSVLSFADCDPVMGDYVFYMDTEKPHRVIVDLGCIQIGQSRDIILNVPMDSNGKYYGFTYFYTYKIGGQSFKIESSSSSTSTSTSTRESDDYKKTGAHIARYNTVELLRKIINHKTIGQHDTATEAFHMIQEYYSSRQYLYDPLSNGIKENIADQVKLAITNTHYFQRWGEFYIDQLSRSLNQQIKPNFKDSACMFGGETFEELVDKASDIFDSLPPPEPSRINLPSTNYRGIGLGLGMPTITPTRVASLANYNSQDTPCFHNECIITLADNSKIPLSMLCKDDWVKSYDIRSKKVVKSRVICILETRIRAGHLSMCCLDSPVDGTTMKITPYHPVYYMDEWRFPHDLTDVFTQETTECESIISLVLDNHHVAYINDVPCITLAHGYLDGILRHPYYGSHLVIQDLQNMEGWDEGHIIMMDGSTIRNKDTGLVEKLIYAPVL